MSDTNRISNDYFYDFKFTEIFFKAIDGRVDADVEPLWYTTPASLDLVVLKDKGHRETELLTSLCDRLFLDWNSADIDGMKSAINNYILNQVDVWFTLGNKELKDSCQTSFKRLCEAQAYLRERPGTYQVYWAAVLENHIKLIASYSDIIDLALKLEPQKNEPTSQAKVKKKRRNT